MLIKMNSKESIEIVEDVFVNVIKDDGAAYTSWDELSDAQQDSFRQMKADFEAVYGKYKSDLNV